jgi:PAS domain S-box-containing protein
MLDHRVKTSAAGEAGAVDAAANDATDASPDVSAFFDVSLDMLCIRDMDGRLTKLSRSWEGILGYPLAELEGGAMLPLIHPDDLESTRAEMARIEGGEFSDEIFGFINRYRRKDGEYRQLEWRAKRRGDKIYGVARDVTERLAAERSLVEAKAAAESANQAKSDFLANMSHEIRTPLNGVIGLAATLGRSGLEPRQKEMVDLIARSGATLERLVSDILDVAKVESGRMNIEIATFDLEVELDPLMETMRVKAEEKGLGFDVRIGATTRGDFLGDALRIKQVLFNLLSNAVKFTETGKVELDIDVVDDAPSPGVAGLILTVRDSGIGFDAGFGVFERFSQADGTITRRFGGSGLGLSICKSLVELMGGTIAVQSAAGKGSTFAVTVPLSRTRSLADYDLRALEALGGALDEAEEGLVGGLRVLLAEDHPVNQRVVQLILGEYGVEVVTVENGAEAVAAFAASLQGGSRFDLILMDMQMPVMDGLAATRAVRTIEAARPEIAATPIVMLSANAMDQHLADTEAAGADRHLAKPFTAPDLIRVVGEVLNEAQPGDKIAAECV